MRLIYADALREYCLNGGSNENIYNTNDFLYELDKAPTIGPESLRPHGEWVYGEDIDIQCSACVADAMTAGDYRQVKSNYCPNCGAKMGEKEETK